MSEIFYRESKPRVLLVFEGEEYTFFKRTKMYNCELEKAHRLAVAVDNLYKELAKDKNINDSLIVKVYFNELQHRILTLESQKVEKKAKLNDQLPQPNQPLSLARKLKILLVGGN